MRSRRVYWWFHQTIARSTRADGLRFKLPQSELRNSLGRNVQIPLNLPGAVQSDGPEGLGRECCPRILYWHARTAHCTHIALRFEFAPAEYRGKYKYAAAVLQRPPQCHGHIVFGQFRPGRL